MIRIEVGGARYENFVEAAVELSIEAISRRFQFSAVTRGVGDIPFRAGQTCRVWIDDDVVATGFVEKIELTLAEGAEEVTYTISGRDKLCDLVDSSIDGMGDFRSTVAASCRSALRFLGIDADVVDLSRSGSRPLADAAEILAPEPTETAADFLWGLAGRRQVLLASDGAGNLVILNGDPTPIETRIVHLVEGAGQNNVVGMRFTSDHSKRFGTYRVVTQKNAGEASFLDIDFGAEEIATTIATHVDPKIRGTRRRSMAGDAHYAAGDAKARARWEANLARAEGLVYVAELSSHRDEAGNLWALNTAPIVEDEFAGIRTRMMIAGIVFRDEEQGETAELAFRRIDAYAAQAALSAIERRAQAAAEAAESDSFGGFDLEDLGLE